MYKQSYKLYIVLLCCLGVSKLMALLYGLAGWAGLACFRAGYPAFFWSEPFNDFVRPSMTEISNQLCTMIEEITEEDASYLVVPLKYVPRKSAKRMHEKIECWM
jgi:hypothetical protein